MFRSIRKVLIALLLAGLVMLVVAPLGTPVIAQETSTRNLRDLLPLTFTIGDVKISWHENRGREPLGVFQEGDDIKLVWHGVYVGGVLTDFMCDYYDLIRFASGGSFIVSYRDREGLGTVGWGNMDIVEEVDIPKSLLKEIPTAPVSGISKIGRGLGGSYTPKDFDLSLLQQLGINLDNGCRWNEGNYYWNPQSPATIDQVAAWLGWMFGKKSNQANPGWKENRQAAVRYYADLGYEFFGSTTAVSSYPQNRTSADYDAFKMFIGVDRALWAGIVKPEELTNEPINRAQFALLACRAFKLSPESVDLSKLPWDLKDPRWQSYLPSIQALLSRGFLKLFPDGSFHPEGNITREEAVKLLYAIKTNNPSSVPSPSTPTTTQQVVLEFFIGQEEYLKNGSPLKMDTTPTILENRTYLPLRAVAEALGAQVEWNQKEQKVTVTTTFPVHFTDTKTDTTFTATRLELWINQPEARVTTATLYYNSLTTTTATIPLDPSNPQVVPLVLPPGRTMLPLRFVAESLGAQVLWDQESQQITVIYNLPGLIQAKEKAYLPPP